MYYHLYVNTYEKDPQIFIIKAVGLVPVAGYIYTLHMLIGDVDMFQAIGN